MDGQGLFRRNRPRWVFSIVGALLAAVIVVGIGPPGLLLQHVTVCQLAAEIGTYTIWTPDPLVNKPEGVNVSVFTSAFNYTFTSGSLTVGQLPANAKGGGGYGDDGPDSGIFSMWTDINWTFYRTTNVSEVGGTPGPCTQAYLAERDLPALGGGGLVTIPLVNSSSDLIEPHIWNGTPGINGTQGPGYPVQTPGTFVWFDTAFHADGSGAAAPVTWNLCNLPGDWPLALVGVARIPVDITAVYQGKDITSSGFMNWYGDPNAGIVEGSGIGSDASAYYSVPGGWNWSLAPVGPVSSPIDPSLPLPGLVAFERSAC